MSPGASSEMSLAQNGTPTITIPKLSDDASNWVDYKAKALLAMGAKGLTGHIMGTVTKPKPYPLANGIAVLADGKSPATEEQIEAREKRIEDFETKQYLACHIMVNTVPIRLAQEIQDETDPKKVWEMIVADSEGKKCSTRGRPACATP